MNFLRKMRNYYFYCGIEKDEYNALKKDAYISNFRVWKILHFVMAVVFLGLFVVSLVNDMMSMNQLYYIVALIYSVIAIILFYTLREDSLAAQLLIYLSMSVLFLFGCLISVNNPEHNATTFIVFLLVTPMFMIDKPFFMTIELGVASAIFLIWMFAVKPYEIWEMDCINVVTYTIIGSFLNVIANSIRIKEFVLTREISVQRDTDEMTGLRNKASLTREINEFLADKSADKGLLFVCDVDRFKSINDNFGHDVGDDVIIQLGNYLGKRFDNNEIVGRFGGDEFIVFVKDIDDLDEAGKIAQEVVEGVSESVTLPVRDQKVCISIGITAYKGNEKNYSDIFKKADMALYEAKANSEIRYCIVE